MKDESCKTCKWFIGNGQSCCKSGGVKNYKDDSCGAYRFKNEQSVIDKYFKEQRIARADKMFRGMA